MPTNPSDSLARAARRAVDQPFFLANILLSYQQANDLDDHALAAVLGCAVANLPRLFLCRRPAAESQAFAADIEHLARRFGLRADQLAAVVRQVDSLQALRQHLDVQPQTPGLLKAARDRDEEMGAAEEQEND